MHSETLGKELGLYEHPSDEMGQLSMEALRSCRLVVDTGMHALGWTKEKALDFMFQNTAMGEHDAVTEVARCVCFLRDWRFSVISTAPPLLYRDWLILISQLVS